MTSVQLAKGAAVLALGAVAQTASVNAAVEGITTTVTRTMSLADDRFGGCAVRLNDAPSEAGLNCSSNWVTFSCSGDHASKSSAARNFDSAQMAFVLGKRVRVWVDDSKTHNGLCFVERIDVIGS